MTFSVDQLLDWLAAYAWPFVRISATLTAMVAFGTQLMPRRVRVLLTLAIALVVVPTLPPMPNETLFSIKGMLITGLQVVVGLAIGFITQMVMQILVLAGSIIAMQSSLGFAAMVDPVSGQQTPVVSQLFLMLATLLFFALDGHLWLLQMLHMSFFLVPVGVDGIQLPNYQVISGFGTTLFASGLSMAIAEVIALLLINITFGYMTRAAPQLNIFTIGFPIIMLSGLLFLWITAANLLDHFMQAWRDGQGAICTLLRTSC
ncbi:flagellar biosynthetic protein FliR [Gallaecimonas xiamenensis]|uniref:Flagellar biosynthetic protein FliR n=1 Tax=Gallaecimonas xiamenensis 3-C-1 TaxID=745411 RepID=K2JJC2_9GAMM|nr:flagellar biosynthetic protein FliR [Gallaecimonas xiamenensis]EKE75408.1 flagellar biosynthesis protein FliR [Gallaecimonas xiamenensis 3-C-1]